jgi:hypothetical protein
MQPIIDRFNSLIRPELRNFAAADAAFVAAQTVGTGVDEARQAVMLAARQAAWRSSGTSRMRSNITSSTGRMPPSRAPKRSS